MISIPLKLTKLSNEGPRPKRTCTFGTCYACGESVRLAKCESEEEYESWEMQHIRYWVFFCYKCGSDQVEPEPDPSDHELRLFKSERILYGGRRFIRKVILERRKRQRR